MKQFVWFSTLVEISITNIASITDNMLGNEGFAKVSRGSSLPVLVIIAGIIHAENTFQYQILCQER